MILFKSVTTSAIVAATSKRRETAERRDVCRRGRELEERVHAGDQIDARRDHRRRVDQRGDRGRALHRVGEPGVEGQLSGLGERTDQEEEADRDDRAVVGLEVARRILEHGQVVEGAKLTEDEERGQDESDVADDVDHERLHARGGRGAAPVPVGDQRVRGEADERPAHNEQNEVPGQDEQQHREDEEVEVGEEPRVALVGDHVGGGVHVDQHRDARDDQAHQHRERVDEDVELDVKADRRRVVPGGGGELALVGRVAEQ